MCYYQKQPPRSVLSKRFSENMPQIYRRIPMPKCDFNKVEKQLYWSQTSAGVFSCKFVSYFQKIFFQEQLWVAVSVLYTYIFNISLNLLRPTFFNICNLPFLRSPNIGKITVKVGPKTNYFLYFISFCTNVIAVFNNFFTLIYSQLRDKQNRACDFFPSKYFLNNKLFTVFMENILSKLVELLL